MKLFCTTINCQRRVRCAHAQKSDETPSYQNCGGNDATNCLRFEDKDKAGQALFNQLFGSMFGGG